MTTKELFDAYFESKGYGVKTRVSVDRAEVYDMEEKLGKPFIEFTPDECIELLKSFRGGKQFSLNSYTTWVSVYRKIFNFYSDNIELIRNPFNDELFRSVDRLSNALGLHENKFTLEDVEHAIQIIGRKSSSIGRARYLECLIRLFLDGVRNFEELVTMCREQIDFEKLTITMNDGIVVHLSERTAYLLVVVHEMDTMKTGLKNSVNMVEWNGHYMKYPTRSTTINDRTLREVCQIISRHFTYDIRKVTGIDITYMKLYNLGLYEYLKKKFGDEVLTQMLDNDRKRGKIVDDFQDALVEYGVSRKNVHTVKRALSQYL